MSIFNNYGSASFDKNFETALGINSKTFPATGYKITNLTLKCFQPF